HMTWRFSRTWSDATPSGWRGDLDTSGAGVSAMYPDVGDGHFLSVTIKKHVHRKARVGIPGSLGDVLDKHPLFCEIHELVVISERSAASLRDVVLEVKAPLLKRMH